MVSDRHRATASLLLEASSQPGEELLGAAPAWVARVGPKGHVFFVGRHRALVALTSHRLVAWRHPKRTMPVVTVDAPLAELRLRNETSARAFFQVLARIDTERGRETVVVELRHRDHAFARAIGRAISGTTASSGTRASS